MLAVDENGKLVDGDQIMAICGNFLKENGKLAKDTIVVTVMTNLGFSLMGEKQGIHVEKTKVGDRYVLENMLENGYNLGGEQSGHVIFLDDNTTGDGLLSALHLLQVMVETKKKLSELAQIMEVLPQALVNAKVPNHKKESYMEYSEIAEAIGELEKKFAGEGRVLIRPSGTEPLVRVMIEGKINPTGLHLRPAGNLCKEALKYNSKITFEYSGNTANAKSVLSVLGACIKSGDEITLICDGEDEQGALRELVAYVESGLGE